jgi:calcineurin-like phosphoesterase family protein
MIWFTSDTHFYHRNIIKYCPESRGQFSDENEMTEYMISAWNSRVKENDVIFHLGDVAFRNPKNAVDVIERLNGIKILIRGNHDDRFLKHQDFERAWDDIYDYSEIKIDGILVVLFHYPMVEWKHMQDGSYHLHGHVHGKPLRIEQGRRMDVGVDTRSDLAPWSWDEIHQYLSKQKILSHLGD